jgi:Nucleoside-diphosphate-sugar epimerases
MQACLLLLFFFFEISNGLREKQFKHKFWDTLYIPHSFTQVYGLGNQTRSFQYVTDLVDGLIALMNSNYTLPVNLGNPTEHSILGKKHYIFLVRSMQAKVQVQACKLKKGEKKRLVSILFPNTM